MKTVKIPQESITNLSNQPLTAIIGSEPYRTRLVTDFLTNKSLYSKKFGRIIYIGEKKYKSPHIIQDEKNWSKEGTYEEIMDFIDEAKKDEIVNMLLVFYPKDSITYSDIIEKLIGIRFTYLKGLISLLVVLPSPHSLKKPLLSKFTNIMYLDTEHIEELKELFSVKKETPEKRKKDAFSIGMGTIELYNDIKD